MVQCIFCIVVFVSCLTSSQTKHHGRQSKPVNGKIVGGYNTTIQQEPYQVYLLLSNGDSYFQCGGSILNENFILTAAHCLVGIEKAYVRVGSTKSDSGGTMYESTDLRIHPFYNSMTSDFDAGIIKIAEGINIDNETTKAVQLSDKKAATREELTVSGWGTTTENGNTSTTLMAVKVKVVSRKTCSKEYKKTLTRRMFCAGQEGKDSCQGDSGGPAVSDNDGTQKGIVSFGIGCARKGYPGVYTEVANPYIKGFIDAQFTENR